MLWGVCLKRIYWNQISRLIFEHKPVYHSTEMIFTLLYLDFDIMEMIFTLWYYGNDIYTLILRKWYIHFDITEMIFTLWYYVNDIYTLILRKWYLHFDIAEMIFTLWYVKYLVQENRLRADSSAANSEGIWCFTAVKRYSLMVIQQNRIYFQTRVPMAITWLVACTYTHGTYSKNIMYIYTSMNICSLGDIRFQMMYNMYKFFKCDKFNISVSKF